MMWLVLIVLGLCLGSFVNALVWRLHEQEALRKKSKRLQSKRQALSIWRGRSMCPNCRHVLAAKDLVPVLSWLALKGKCRYCGQPISWQYPLVELLTAALFIFSYSFWPVAFRGVGLLEFSLWLMFVTGFVALAVYDLRWFVLPDRIAYPLLGLALLQLLVVAGFYRGGVSSLLGGLWGVLVLGGIFYGLFRFSRGAWIGGGDAKLGVVIGLLVGGPLASLLVIFAASVLGSAVAVPLLVTGRARPKTRLPFGPFLIAAAIFVRLFGAGVIAWYKRLVTI